MELFLDANAHVKLNNKALFAQNEFLKSFAANGNPAAPNKPGREAAFILEKTREKITNLLGAEKPSQIIFTGSATSACSAGIFLLDQIEKKHNINLNSSAIEHPAIKNALQKYNHKLLSVDCNGTLLDTEKIENEKIICLLAQNEYGTIQDLTKIKCKYLLSDISQAVGKISINLKNTNIDIGIISPHKFGGPCGIGILYLKDINNWKSFDSGSRYGLDRAGTMDICSVIATAEALEDAINTLENRTQKMYEFKNIIEQEFLNMNISVIAKNAFRLPNTTFINLPNKCLELLMELEKKEIYVGLGSACGSLTSSISSAIKAIGCNGTINDFMRISQWGEYGKKEAEYFIQIFKEILK